MEIVTINEFLIKRPVIDFQDLINNPTQYTVNIKNNWNEFVSIINNDRNRYIEDGILILDGGLSIKQYNKEILGFQYWDDLPTLWSYILNVIEEYLENGIGKAYFPSQPIKIQLKLLQNKKIHFLIGDHALEFEQKMLLGIILNRAEFFFNILVKELNLTKYNYEIEQIKKLKASI